MNKPMKVDITYTTSPEKNCDYSQKVDSKAFADDSFIETEKHQFAHYHSGDSPNINTGRGEGLGVQLLKGVLDGQSGRAGGGLEMEGLKLKLNNTERVVRSFLFVKERVCHCSFLLFSN